MKTRFYKIFLLVCLSLGLLVSTRAEAAGASLFLSPDSGAHAVGESFVVRIFVSSSQSVNTFDVYVTTNNLTVTGINSGGSICSLYPTQPSKTATTAHYQCGLPTPGYKGSSGYIGSVTVRGNFQGVATMSITSASKVLANDGSGSNILSSRSGASFTIQPPPTSAPTISSSTHPNQESWYKNKTSTLKWSSPEGSNFSYVLDNSPSTNPDTVSEGAGTNKTYENLSDGIYYFHVKVRGADGWSAPANFRIQIDSTPPDPFTPEADPKDNATKRPIIAFATKDATSGVDHYEIRLDDGSWVRANNPFKIASITSGKHTVSVKAIDKAGNERVGTVEVTVKELEAPIIVEPKTGTFFSYGAELIIKGEAINGYKIKIFLDGKEIGSTTTNEYGKFEYTYKELLRPGEHKLFALAVNSEGIESAHSNEIIFHTDPRAFVFNGITIPAIAVFISVLFLILILIVILIFFFITSLSFRRKVRHLLKELEVEVDSDLNKENVKKKVRDEVKEDFEVAEEKVD